MGLFSKTGVGAHKAIVSSDRSKTSKDRLVSRAGRLKTALEGPMPRDKKRKLKAELRGILGELDARQEAIEEIMQRFED